MSTSEDDSSLQLTKKLLPSGSTSSTPTEHLSNTSSELGILQNHENHCHSPAEVQRLLGSDGGKIGSSENGGVPSAVSARHDPDVCYSWLHTPLDSAHAGGKRSKQDSVSSDESSTSSSLPMPQAPDGGWGWLVVLGAFTITLICDGISYCFGVLYSELLVQFGESRSKTSLVGAIFFGIAMILGPLASALTTRFGCRTMTIFGGLMASAGLFLSQFATSIDMLCITFSVIVGTGFSFCYITSVVIVAFYFDKRRALATGLAVCGTGVGTFTFAPLMDYLIQEYGWRGLFLILSGLSLNLVMCGMLFLPLHFTESERWEMLLQEFNKIPYSREDIEMSRSRYPSDSTDSDSEEEALEEEARTLSVLSLPTFVNLEVLDPPSDVLMEALKNSKNPHRTLQRYMKNAMSHFDHHNMNPEVTTALEIDTPVDGKTVVTLSSSLVKSNEMINSKTEETIDSVPSSLLDENVLKLCTPANIICVLPKPALSDSAVKNKGKEKSKTASGTKQNIENDVKQDSYSRIIDGKMHTKLLESLKENEVTNKRSEFSAMSSMLTSKGCEMEGKSVAKRIGGVHIGRHSALGIHLPLYRTDIFYRRLLRHQPYPKLEKTCVLGTSCPEIRSMAPEAERHIIIQTVLNFSEEASDIMKSMVEFKLFLNPFFVVFVISNFLLYFWSDIPYMYAADHAMLNGVDPRKASFLLSIIGIFNTIGQVVFGCIGDMDVNLLNIYAIISAISGIFVAIVPLMDNYIAMCIVYALFGFSISVSFPLTTVLLVNFLGVAKLTNAYGLLMLMQGIANLFGPPFAGWVSDETGTYDSAFYLSGLFYGMSGLVLFLIYIPKCRYLVHFKREPVEITIKPDFPCPV